ncbi:MAG: hypothetical protein ACTH58_11015 [Marinomonas foliarum]|uniref:hypothetical protein n=1 Tax=Marinomonas foliarum TaxID=491950 RepID=UPI000DF4261D|nr:hypothetical protein [Marinomonas foliarum]
MPLAIKLQLLASMMLSSYLQASSGQVDSAWGVNGLLHLLAVGSGLFAIVGSLVYKQWIRHRKTRQQEEGEHHDA